MPRAKGSKNKVKLVMIDYPTVDDRPKFHVAPITSDRASGLIGGKVQSFIEAELREGYTFVSSCSLAGDASLDRVLIITKR